MQKILYRWTLKNWPEGASSMRGHPPYTHTLEKHGGAGDPAPPGSRRLWTSQNTSQIGQESVLWNCVGKRKGILAGSWDMCEPKSGGSGNLLPPPLPGKWGGERPPCPPPCSYAYGLVWSLVSPVCHTCIFQCQGNKWGIYTLSSQPVRIHSCSFEESKEIDTDAVSHLTLWKQHGPF